jgi:hypothetical protein
MAENQTKAQIILEANSAAFMAQIRSIAAQVQGIFSRVFSTLRLPGLLSIGGLVAASVAMPATGRTIGEAVQMQRLHAQLDRLNATLIAELAPVRILILKILIVLLGAINFVARLFSNLINKTPEVGDFIKGLATLAVFALAFRQIPRIAEALAKGIFTLAGGLKTFRILKRAQIGPFSMFFTSLYYLLGGWLNVLHPFMARMRHVLRGFTKFDILGSVITWLKKFDHGLLRLTNRLELYEGFGGPIVNIMLPTLMRFVHLISAISRIIVIAVNFLVSGLVTLVPIIGSLIVSALGALGAFVAALITFLAAEIAAFVAGLVAVFGVLGTIALSVAVIMGVISVIYLLYVAFEYIVAGLKWLGSVIWSLVSWLGQALYLAGSVILMIIGFIGKRLLGLLAYVGSLLLNYVIKPLLNGLWWLVKNFIIAPISALGRWAWDKVSSLLSGISDWFSSLFEEPPFTIQGMSSFGGFSKEELELASPRLPELINIGGTVVNLLDQIKKLLEQQRSAAVKRVSGI